MNIFTVGTRSHHERSHELEDYARQYEGTPSKRRSSSSVTSSGSGIVAGGNIYGAVVNSLRDNAPTNNPQSEAEGGTFVSGGARRGSFYEAVTSSEKPGESETQRLVQSWDC